jgi:hypothetical protein
MRLDFNVLWVEDQPNAVRSQCVSIERQIRKEGFRLQVQFATSLSKAEELLSSDIFGDHIDLVLMDYDLGVGAKGDVGLGIIRKIFPYKDVIFYSAEAADLLDKVANAHVQGSSAHVQGIYCSTRPELPDTVVGAFEALVKKVLDIDHSRGIVMGATSDIDHHVNDSLVAVFSKSSEENKAATLNKLMQHLKKKRVDFDEEAKFIEAVKHVSELLDRYNIYTSNDRLKLLKTALEVNALHSEKIDGIKKYLSEVVPKRNQLAHVQVQTEGFSRRLVNKKGEEFTSKDMKELRLSLLENQELFEALSEELTRSAPQQTITK